MTDSQTLLAEYVHHGSEAAFRELVTRHLNLVYSTAIHLTGGDAHLAEDVSQTVFVDLARLARSFSGAVRLGGWLHRHTCFVAAKTVRGERRRQSRERQAVAMNAQPDHSAARFAQVAPLLDEAINQLGAADRAAVLLRFYEQLDFRSVGEALGTNEDAAQKRVSRALEKLHLLLKHRGVALSTAALGTALAGEAVTAAPAALAASIAGTALASVAGGTGGTLALLKFMANTKLQAGLITAIIIVSGAAPLLVQRQAQARLSRQDESSRRQSDQLANLQSENQRLSTVLAKAETPRALTRDEFAELLRLRGEIGRLEQGARELARAKTNPLQSRQDRLAAMEQLAGERANRLRHWLEQNPAEAIPELQFLTEAQWRDALHPLAFDSDREFRRSMINARRDAEDKFSHMMYKALKQYAQASNGQFPTDLSQLLPYFATTIDPALLQRYEIVPVSELPDGLQVPGNWAITQKAPVNKEYDGRNAIGLTKMIGSVGGPANAWVPAHQ